MSNYPAGVDSTDIDRHFGNSDTRIDDGLCFHPCVLCEALAVPHELPERGELGGGCEAFERSRGYALRDFMPKYISKLFCPDCAEFLDGLGYTLGGFEAHG